MPFAEYDDVVVYDEDESVYSDEWEQEEYHETDWEFEEEIHQSPFGLWPLQENYEWRPNVVHLASLYAPVPLRPEPLLEVVQKKFDTYKEERRAASHAKSQAEKKMAAKGEEMKKAEAEPEKPKAYGSKWSDKAKGGEADSKKALLKRLGDEFEDLAQKVQKEIQTMSQLDAANESIVKMVESHEACVEGYEAYKTFVEGNSRKMYGKVVTLPICH